MLVGADVYGTVITDGWNDDGVTAYVVESDGSKYMPHSACGVGEDRVGGALARPNVVAMPC